MRGKRLTLLVLPSGPHDVKKYSISRYLPAFIGLSVLFLIGGLAAYSIYAYKETEHARKWRDESVRLRQKAGLQDIQIRAFADKIALLEQEMSKLRQYDVRLEEVVRENKRLGQGASPGLGGSDLKDTDPRLRLKADSTELIRLMHRQLDSLLSETSLREVQQHQLGNFLEESRSILASTPTAFPLHGRITSLFGYRDSPFGGRQEFHKGLDIDGNYGEIVKAPADGVVVSVERDSGYGLMMTVNHGNGLVTRYAHLSQAFAEAGQTIRRGLKICAVGNSGRTTGPHLHYEVFLNGVPVNPMRFLALNR